MSTVTTVQNDIRNRLIQIPSKEVLTVRFLDIAMPGQINYMARKLFPRLMDGMADRQLHPVGVALGITLAMHDACEGLPPMISILMRVHYPALVEALVPDKSFHADILEALNG